MHARICNFASGDGDSDDLGGTGVFIASDKTMRDFIFYVPFDAISCILKYGFVTFGNAIEDKISPHAEQSNSNAEPSDDGSAD